MKLRQSIGTAELFSSMAAGAAVTWVVWKLAVEPMGYIADNGQMPIVQQSHEWNSLLLTNLPIVFLIIAVVGSIAWVVYQTRFA